MHILICIKGTSGDRPAIRLGRAISSRVPTTTTLLHIPGRREPGTPQNILSQAQGELDDPTAQTKTRPGNPVREILAEVRIGEYDLLIIGAHREDPPTSPFPGSVAQEVVRRAPISILLARSPALPLEHFLICTGGLDCSLPTVETGVWLAQVFRTQATLLHVLPAIPSMYTGLGEVEETLPELLQTDTPTAHHLRNGAALLAQGHVPAELKLRYGVATDEIMREAQREDYNLIILGASESGGRLQRWLVGDVTLQIVERATQSVLVVRGRFKP